MIITKKQPKLKFFLRKLYVTKSKGFTLLCMVFFSDVGGG